MKSFLILISPRYWPTWIGIGLLRVSELLPFGVLLRLGTLTGRIVRRLPLRYVTIARRNLELCFPDMAADERERLLRDHLRSLGIALFETAMSWWSPDDRLLRLIRFEGLQNLHRALERGQGAILLLGHFTTMEIAGRALTNARVPLNVLYRPTSNRALAWFLQRNRNQRGARAIRRDDIRGLIAALKANEVVWYAPDQSYRKKGAKMVPFFGIPAATNTATSRLARLTGAPVLFYSTERLPGTAGYRMVIQPPLEDFPSDDPVADALRVHEAIEQQIRRVPAQYLWIHRRFKGLGPDDPDYYATRRQSAPPAAASKSASSNNEAA